MIALTFTLADIGNWLRIIWGIISPFIILFLGWEYNKKQKLENKKQSERDAEKERINQKIRDVKKEVEQLSAQLTEISHKFEILSEALENDKSFDRINEILDITQGLLFYCFQLGTLVINISQFIKSEHDMNNDDSQSFTTALEHVKQKEQELQESIFKINRRGVKK